MPMRTGNDTYRKRVGVFSPVSVFSPVGVFSRVPLPNQCSTGARMDMLLPMTYFCLLENTCNKCVTKKIDLLYLVDTLVWGFSMWALYKGFSQCT